MAKLKWRDSEDVYKPISHSLWEFLQDKKLRINERHGRGIEALYRQLSNKKMIVFVEREAEIQLIHHLSIDPYNETGGVFVGQAYFCKETNTHYTEIIGSIAAPYTIGNRVHFKFTAESWQEILKNHKQNYPTTTIVGWYHSHPGHGVFLSGTDLNTQRSISNKIWQISTVYDTLHKDIGYFYGADGIKSSPIYLQDINGNIFWQQPQLPETSSLYQSGYDTPETNPQQEVSAQIQPVHSREHPQNTPTRLETNRRTGLNPSNISSNTPPRNPPPPTVNPRPTISNASSSSRNTTPPSSSFTNPSSSSRTQGSSSLSGWGCGVAILVAIAAALSPVMSALFTAQFSQFSNNSTTQKNQQPPLTPKQVVTAYYQSATSNPEADLPLRSDAFKSYWKPKDQGNKTEEFFKQFQKVDVYSVQTLTQSSTNSKVRVWLKYVWKNNKTTCESQIMELIFAQSQGQWLIDKVSDVEYNLDCGK